VTLSISDLQTLILRDASGSALPFRGAVPAWRALSAHDEARVSEGVALRSLSSCRNNDDGI
jgi:hypothetical protein